LRQLKLARRQPRSAAEASRTFAGHEDGLPACESRSGTHNGANGASASKEIRNPLVASEVEHGATESQDGGQLGGGSFFYLVEVADLADV
jgi:anti-sigma factor RsiW